MRIFLTGAGGFLGKALACRIKDEGHQLAVLTRPRSQFNRRAELQDTPIVYSDGDLCEFLESFQPEIVIHTACLYGRQGESMIQLADVNVGLGVKLLHSLLQCDRPVTFLNTGTALHQDASLYAMTKRHFTDWGAAVAREQGRKLQFVNIELQHMYGPGDHQSKFTAHVLKSCRQNSPELMLTAGEQRRDFIYIDDVVDAYALLMKRGSQLEGFTNIEVGSGVAPTVREFVETVHELTKSKTSLKFGALPYRPNEAMYCKADISQMKKLGWQPKFDLKSGLMKTLAEEYT